jgi:hypothetical protein
MAATSATTGQNGLTILRLHPRPKAVRFGALAIIRLKSTFRHFGSIE